MEEELHGEWRRRGTIDGGADGVADGAADGGADRRAGVVMTRRSATCGERRAGT